MRKDKSITRMSALLTIITVAIFALTFTACSDDDDLVTEVTYTYGFSSMSASHPDFLAEMSKIEKSFQTALGITGKPFTKIGTVEECDKMVYEACLKAFDSLKGEVWQGDYTFQVTNVGTANIVYKAIFRAENENRTPVGNKAMDDVEMGDFYFSDGSFADKDAELTARQANNCIGIVFYVGQHTTDTSDYSDSGIKQTKCNGYALALTDVGKSEWGSYGVVSGVSTNNSDWEGYSNQKELEKNIDKYPAAKGCRDYGKGNDGKYAAPTKSSGWFLPSCGQLCYLYSNGSLLFSQINKCKEKSQDNNITWFKIGRYYWSSSERSADFAWNMVFHDGYVYDRYKNKSYDVRGVLAF